MHPAFLSERHKQEQMTRAVESTTETQAGFGPRVPSCHPMPLYNGEAWETCLVEQLTLIGKAHRIRQNANCLTFCHP